MKRAGPATNMRKSWSAGMKAEAPHLAALVKHLETQK
jgi:hypothetical protein